MRRFPLIILGFVFLTSFGIIADMIELLSGLLPIFIVYTVLKSVLGEEKKKDRKRTTPRSTYKTNEARKYESSVDRNAINRKLKSYFSENYKLRLFEEIALTTSKGEYKDFDSLYISINDEIICSLKEFGENHPDMYRKILKLLETFAKEKTATEKKVIKEDKPVIKENPDKASDYIEKINALNNEIPHVEITNSLNQTCDYLRRIASAAKKDDAKLTKLYNYYLPILIGILENYKNLQDNRDSSEYKKCEDQLIKLTILINDALKAINESLHEEEYMELNADMATLESLLKKDILDDGMVK